MPHLEHDKEKPHIPELDGIRGVAISLVVAFHYFNEPAGITPGSVAWHVLAPIRIGWTGVDLFFVLSGFLIGGILLDARRASNYFRTFYTRRFYRIWPLSAVVVCVCYLQTALLEHGFAPRLSWMLDYRLPWYPYIFFIQNFWMAARNTFGTWGLGGTWSLAIEEQFYLTLPVLIWLFEPKKLEKFLVAAVVAAPLMRTLFCIVWPDNNMLAFALMPCRADALLLGVLGAIAIRTPAYWTWIETHGRLILGTIIVLLLGCALSLHMASSPFGLLMRTIGYTWMAVLYSLILVYSLTQKSSLISRALRINLLRSLGKIAYGVYLLHAYVLTLLTLLVSPFHPFPGYQPALDSWSQLGVCLAALVLTVILCQLSWRYFEKPLVQIGHRSKYKFDSVPHEPEAAQLASS